MYQFRGAVLAANCQFEGNSAPLAGSTGGGVMLQADSYGEFQNCVFWNNDCGYAGGGAAFVSLFAGGQNFAPYGVFANCTVYGNSAANLGGGIFSEANAPDPNTPFPGLRIDNSILWANSAGSSPGQIYSLTPNSIPVTYSDVQGGYAGTGNIDADPQFRDPAGGDFGLRYYSPCVNVGDNGGILNDATDLDDGGSTLGVAQRDLPMFLRIVSAVVEIGAVELCPGDLNEDGETGLGDLTLLLSYFGTDPCTGEICYADFDQDGAIDIGDLTILISEFGTVCYAGESSRPASQDPLIQWILSATPEEILEWWESGMPNP